MDPTTRALADAAAIAVNLAEAIALRRAQGRSAEDIIASNLASGRFTFYYQPRLMTDEGLRIPDFAVLGAAGTFSK